MVDTAIALLLFVVGMINFVPVFGVLSAARIARAYSVELVGSDLAILMRHRALLFGVVGGFIFYAVFNPAMHVPAMVMAAISMLGYLFLLWQEGGYNAALRKVMWVDVVGVACLVGAVVLKLVA